MVNIYYKFVGGYVPTFLRRIPVHIIEEYLNYHNEERA